MQLEMTLESRDVANTTSRGAAEQTDVSRLAPHAPPERNLNPNIWRCSMLGKKWKRLASSKGGMRVNATEKRC